MAKGQWVGVNGVARKVKNKYVGVGGVARKVKAGWVGVAGVARQYFGGISYKFVELQSTVSYVQSQTLSAGPVGNTWVLTVTVKCSDNFSDGQPPTAFVEIDGSDLAGQTLSIVYTASERTIYAAIYLACFNSAGASVSTTELTSDTSKTLTIPDGTSFIRIGAQSNKDGTNTRTLTITSLTIGNTKLL